MDPSKPTKTNLEKTIDKIKDRQLRLNTYYFDILQERKEMFKLDKQKVLNYLKDVKERKLRKTRMVITNNKSYSITNLDNKNIEIIRQLKTVKSRFKIYKTNNEDDDDKKKLYKTDRIKKLYEKRDKIIDRNIVKYHNYKQQYNRYFANFIVVSYLVSLFFLFKMKFRFVIGNKYFFAFVSFYSYNLFLGDYGIVKKHFELKRSYRESLMENINLKIDIDEIIEKKLI